MGIKNKYIDQAVSVLARIHPEASKSDIEKFVKSKYDEFIKDPSIYMDNNVTKAKGQTTLTGLTNYIDNKLPVVSGNGTFYMQPSTLRSPTSNMLRGLKKDRKAVKKKMFGFAPGSYEYKKGDLVQGNKKVIMNAEYGGSGTPTAAFYTKYSPAATTLMAQSIITTMAALFEGYLGDNQKFFNINECYDWMERIFETKKDFTVDKWIRIPSVEECALRIKRHFHIYFIGDDAVLNRYISSLSEDQRVFLYYANNLNEFMIAHEPIKKLLQKILTKLPNYEASESDIPNRFVGKFKDTREYNKWVADEMFMNPYQVPNSIKKEMEQLREYATKYCFVEYLTPDSIAKLNNHKRNTVLLVDTDSNVINSNLFVTAVLDNMFQNESFGRKRLYNDMICVSICAYLIDICVLKILDYYGIVRHMDDAARAELTMKNEFMFRLLFLMAKKKRYCASIALREGNIMLPFKLEMKGLDFIKSGVTGDVKKRFTNILKDNILACDEIDLHHMMQEIRNFEKEIYEDLRRGGTRYLKPQQFKSESAYKDYYDSKQKAMISGAWKIQGYKGGLIWNILYPDRKIYSLDRIKLVKTIIMCEEDLEIIKDHKDVYETLKREVFHSDNFQLRNAGVKYISIPAELKVLPEWMIPIIDYKILISDIMASFNSIMSALRIEAISINTPSGKGKRTSALISF